MAQRSQTNPFDDPWQDLKGNTARVQMSAFDDIPIDGNSSNPFDEPQKDRKSPFVAQQAPRAGPSSPQPTPFDDATGFSRSQAPANDEYALPVRDESSFDVTPINSKTKKQGAWVPPTSRGWLQKVSMPSMPSISMPSFGGKGSPAKNAQAPASSEAFQSGAFGGQADTILEDEAAPSRFGGGGLFSGGGSSIKSGGRSVSKETALEQKERELKAREEAVRKAELSSPVLKKKNWPLPFFPIARHNIGADIPAGRRTLCRVVYLSYVGLAVCFVWNIVCTAAAWAVGELTGSSGPVAFGFSVLYAVLGITIAWPLWYKRLYNALCNDRGLTFAWFFLAYLLHIVWCGFAAIAPPIFVKGKSLTGLISFLNVLGGNTVVVFFYLAGFIAWTVEFFYSVVVLQRVYSYFRNRGPNNSRSSV